jgi:hypothetical protein
MRKIGRAVGFFLLIAALGCSRGGNKSSSSPNRAAPSISPLSLVLSGSPQASAKPAGSVPPAATHGGTGPADLGDLARPSPSAAKQSAVPGPRSSAQPQATQSGPFALFSLSPLKLAFPQDFDIGAVQGEYPGDDDERTAALAAYAFLESLKSGTLDPSTVVADELPKITQTIHPFTKKNLPLVDFRLGLLKRDGDEAQAHAALYSKEGMAIAEIYLAKSGAAWKVEAFSADFDSLDKPVKKPDARFEPGEYKAFTPF